MSKGDKSPARKLMVPGVMMAVFWTLAVVLSLSSGQIFFLINFGYIGTAIGLGMGLYALLPRRRKPAGRKLAQFLVGGYMLGFLGLLGHENMQIEGFFFYLLAGYMGGAVMHYLIAKVIGPIIFNRGWCGWACWTAMVLDVLPYDKSKGWVPGGWRYLRHAHFALSLGLVLALWHGFGYRYKGPMDGLYWLLAGNAFYFASAILMAVVLKDNRAFCKYLCPITVILKATSRFSLMKIKGNAELCTSCGACTRACPMDIGIPDYIKDSRRVLSTECTICETCISTCPKEALSLSFGFDLGGRELLRERKGSAGPAA